MGISAGIDLGSTMVKLAIIENGHIVKREAADAASRPLDAAKNLLKLVPEGCAVMATGYGRDLLEIEYGFPAITEIKAHAVGARFLDNSCSAVIDIGGQDVKAMMIDTAGKVGKFEMNDRCSAGTGRFLEIMAQRLGFTLEEFQRTSARGAAAVTINSMCTVFAESEVIGLLARGFKREDIGHALHLSIARRIAAMFSRIGQSGSSVLATGGGSLNTLLVSMVGTLTCCALNNCELSQYAGAIGCALYANNANLTKEKYGRNNC
jgi:predicted CoA-substrate-specific enzyme activase